MKAFKITVIILLLIATSLVVGFKPLTQSEEPPTSISIDIPDYTKTRLRDLDYITIEGGTSLYAEEGRPIVPKYIKSYNYPGNYKIQDVILKIKSGLKTEEGLKLPVVNLAYIPTEHPVEMKPGIYPQVDFRWESYKNSDGTYSLNITVYPVSYDPENLRLTFYKHYEFEIKYITSSVEIRSVITDKYVYSPKDILKANVYVNNPGDPKDIILATFVRRYGTEETVDGLPLKSLKALSGDAIVSMEWDTKNIPDGYYVLDVTIFDKASNYLDKNSVEFFIGQSLITVTNFTVSPKRFSIGDKIDIDMKFKNDGTSEISGKCVFEVTESNGVIKEFSHDFANLESGATLEFSDKWDTATAKKGVQYKVIGYVSYSARTTPPQVEIVSTNFPPTANFSYSPEKCIVNKDITFDASSSTDSDGNVVSYYWDFGDGAISESKTVIHSFLKTGTYNVSLLVTDNNGGTSSVTKKINVIQEVTPPKPPPTEKIIIRLYIGKTTYYVNDVPKTMDVAPIIKESRTLLPIRYVAEALGADVAWDAKEQKVTINFKGTTIELWIGKNTARVNGEYRLIDTTNPKVTPVIIPPGRTMLPIRFIAENLGCLVGWDDALKEVKITYPAP